VLSELAANLDRQVKSQSSGASQRELEELKTQMEKNKNSLIFDNFKQRNVCRLSLSLSLYVSVCV